MIPTFGPRAGGTKVVIVGGFLGRENSSVSVRTWVGEITFKVEYRYLTQDHSCRRLCHAFVIAFKVALFWCYIVIGLLCSLYLKGTLILQSFYFKYGRNWKTI